MESRLGVRAADAKTLPHYHYMALSNRITRIHPTTSFLAGQLCWGWGQKDRRHLNHWSGSPPDRSVRALRRSCLYSAMQSATRRVWLRLPAKGEVAAARWTKKCGILCLPWKKTQEYCTIVPSQYCTEPTPMNSALTSTAILRLSRLQMGNRPKLYSPKNTPTKTSLAVYVRARGTWQYRHGTGEDIKHVVYVQCMELCTNGADLDIKHRKTENSQRNFHGSHT